MPGSVHNSDIRGLRKRPDSPTISVVLALLCLALAGCSPENEPVTPDPDGEPPVAGPPAIASVAPATFSTGRVILTATVKANGLPTQCFFQYGVYSGFNSTYSIYGLQTPSKPIGEIMDGVVVCDTVSGLGVDTTYHFRCVAMNSGGTTFGTEQTFVITAAPPVITSFISVVPGGLEVTVSATVRPNGRETRCYFEYGQTTSYGNQLSTASIGGGYSDSVVSSTITVPAPGTTMHCRLVAMNSQGRIESADRAFSLVEFVYPLTVGTQWKYSYEEWCLMGYHIIPGYIGSHIRGTQMWTVVGTGSPDSVCIQVSRIDSVERYDQGDSVMTSVTSFTVSISSVNYRVRWYELILAPFADREYRENSFSQLITVPRYLESGSDPLTIGNDGGNSNSFFARYVNGRGLVSFRKSYAGHSSINETLTLDSVYVAP